MITADFEEELVRVFYTRASRVLALIRRLEADTGESVDTYAVKRAIARELREILEAE